jgi:TP901 family phage tail tape measure protein
MASSRSVRAGRAFVEFFLEDNPLKRGLTVAERRLRQFGARVQNIGRTAFAAGFGGLAATALPVAQLIRFDDAIRMTGAVSQATGVQLEQLRETALELGRTTSFTAVEVAQLMGELGKAGFSPDEINTMTAAVLNLSRASGTDAVMSAGLMAATLRQFSLGAEQATRVSDVLTLAANATFNSVEQLGEALSYAGPVAADLGMSLEDTVAILGTLGNVGIQGSNAGTALRRLGTITAAEADKMRQLFGVEFLDAAGNLRPLVQVMGELARATNGLPSGQRIAKMNEAFGLLGITGATVIANTAAETEQLSKALTNAGGVAAKTAANMDAGPGGVWRRFTSAVEGAAIAIGTALAPMLEEFGTYITDLTGKITGWIAKNQQLIVYALQMTAAVFTAGVALIAIAKILSSLAVVAAVAGAAVALVTKIFSIATATVGLLGSAVTLMLNPWIAIPVVLAAAGVAIAAADVNLQGMANTMITTLAPAYSQIVDMIRAGDLEGALELAMAAAWAAIKMGMINIRSGMNEMGITIREIWAQLWSNITYAPVSAVAMIQDKIQELTDWANRLVGRDVPQRISNTEKLGQIIQFEEDQRQATYEAERQAYASEIQAVQLELQNATDNAKNRAEKIQADKKEINQIPGMPAATASPGNQLATQVRRNVSAVQQERAAFVDAVDKRTQEGQRAIYESLNQQAAQDETTDAVKSLEGTLEDEFERTRRETRQNAVVIKGSRR